MKFLLGKVKGCVLICCLLSIVVFKSLQAAEPVNLTEWYGLLSSPNYPATYPSNSSFTWIKSVSPGNIVKITIFDFQTTCDADYLEIRDGDSLASPLIARYCGTVSYTEITSSGTQLLLHFVSDDVTDGPRGFRLLYSGECNVVTNQTNGLITPPNYPENYPNYMDCLWTIQLHHAMQITLKCDEIALEYQEACEFDYMEILAGASSESPVMGKYCGVLNHSLTFERDGNMSIRFKSDSDKEFHGFRCEYSTDKVRGYWTQWTSWTECSQTCYHGNQTRSRTCVNPLPDSGLVPICDDVADSEMRSCLVSNCTPVDGGYTNWSNWSSCHVTCGTGFRNRSRDCTNPPPAYAGKNCSEIGEPWDTTECVLAPCPGETSTSWTSSVRLSSSPLSATALLSDHLSTSALSTSGASVELSSSDQFFVTTPSASQSDPTVSSRLDSVALPSSQPRVLLFSSPADITLSSNQFVASQSQSTPRPSQSHPTVSSSRYSVTPFLSQTHITSNQFVTSQSHGIPGPSQSGISLPSSGSHDTQSVSKFYGASSLPSTTPQVGIENTDRPGGVTYMHSTLETFQTSSFETQIWSAFKESLPANSEFMSDTPSTTGQPQLTLDKTSSTTGGHSASLISKTSFQLHQSVESSDSVHATQDNVVLSINTSTSKQTLSLDGDLPLPQTKPSSLATTNSTRDVSLATSTPINSTSIKSLHQKSIQKTQLTSLQSLAYIHNQTALRGVPSQRTDSTSSISEALMLKGHHNKASTSESASNNFYSNSKLSMENSYFSASVDDTSTHTLLLTSIANHSKPVATVGSALHGKYSSVVSTSNEINPLPTSYTQFVTPTTINTFTKSFQQHPSSIYNASVATPTCCESSRMPWTHDSVLHLKQLQSTHDSSKALSLQIQNLKTAMVTSTQSELTDQAYEQSAHLLSQTSTLQTDSLRTVKETYSASMDGTHGQTQAYLSVTLRMDSYRTTKRTYGASIRPTHGQSKHHSPKTLQTDSLRTSANSASLDHASLVGIDNSSEMASTFQLRLSTFQVQSSLSSLSPTLASTSVPSHPADDPVTPSAFQFPWHLVPFLVILFIIVVVLITYYSRIPDIVENIILWIKDKRKQMKKSKQDNSSLDLTNGNFSTEGLKTSHFHSYQREVFYEEPLNYAFFETEATKAIEFSVQLDDELEPSCAGSEESVEISCKMEEEAVDGKQEHDTLSEMFNACDTDSASR